MKSSSIVVQTLSTLPILNLCLFCHTTQASKNLAWKNIGNGNNDVGLHDGPLSVSKDGKAAIYGVYTEDPTHVSAHLIRKVGSGVIFF